jgi:hypothetical protein
MSDATARLDAALADRYRIGRELGRGGMATVYLADDRKHDRKVAITPDLTRFVCTATEAHADAWLLEAGTEDFP